MRLAHPISPLPASDWFHISSRSGKAFHGTDDRQVGFVNPAHFRRIHINMNEFLLRHRQVDKTVTPARHLPQTGPYNNQQVGILYPLR